MFTTEEVRGRRAVRATTVGVAVFSVFALAACGGIGEEAGGGGSGDSSAIRVGITPSVYNSTMNLAVDAELGDAHGYSVERTTVGGAGSTNQVSALLAGDLDVAVGGTNTVIDAIAQGADLQIIAGMAPLLFSLTLSDDAAAATGVSPDDPIEERVKALEGLKVAASPSGSTGNIVLQAILESYGMSLDEDVTLVPLNDLGAIPSGLVQGTFDASFAAVGTGEVAVASGDAETWLSLPKGDIPEFEPYVGIVAYARTDYVEQNPDAIEATVAALNDAQQMTVDDPDQAAGYLTESIFAEMDDAVFDATWAQVEGAYIDGSSFTEENWQTIVDLFDATSDNDYASMTYTDIVAEIARG